MDLQERYDNLSTGQKVLMYIAAVVMLILSAAISFNGMVIFGIIIFLLDLIYFFIILFFSLKHIKFNKTTTNTIINTTNTITNTMINTIIKVFLLIIVVVFIIMIVAVVIGSFNSY